MLLGVTVSPAEAAHTASHAPDLDLTHLQLDVRDLDRSERFYRDALGMPVERRETSLAIRRPGYLLVISAGVPSAAGSFHFGFRVPSAPDVDTWFGSLRGADVTIVSEPKEANGVHVGRISDPDGYPIEISCDL